MSSPSTKAWHSLKRKRNVLAKKMYLDSMQVKKVHDNKKDREKQRKWRMKDDPENDYENLDDWLVSDG